MNDLAEAQSRALQALEGTNPKARALFVDLQEHLRHGHAAGYTKTRFLAFEGFRHPARQEALYQSGANVTKVRGWYSSHNYGLAVDYVPWDDQEGWSWGEEHDYDFLSRTARKCGLWTPISWDRVHVEHPAWAGVKALLLT